MRRKTSIISLLALCALAAGAQALAPASAGAVANQLTDCEPTAVPGIGINGKTGVPCILGGSGVEVVEIEGSPVLCPTRSNCLARGPLHAGPGGGGGDADEADPGDGRGRLLRGVAALGFASPEERRKAREKRLNEIDPKEREFKQALCSVIEGWMVRVFAHWPEDAAGLRAYRRDMKLHARGMNPGFVEDEDKNRGLQVLGASERKSAILQRLSDDAECWVVE